MLYIIIAFVALAGHSPSFGATLKLSMNTVTEETFNGMVFKQVTEIENNVRKESFYINGKVVAAEEFERVLLDAQKEENRKERKKLQEDRIRVYESQYKARVKIEQADLKQAVGGLEHELQKLADERIKPFMVYSYDTISSADQVMAIREKLLGEAKKLVEGGAEGIDIKKITDMTTQIKALIPKAREVFIASVNNGINKADDTKLLKELLNML